MKNQAYIIYALIDPRDNQVRYIGQTEYPNIRLQQHIQGDGNIPKRMWIGELHRLGLSPVMETIETVKTLADALEREEYWVQYFLDSGAQLVNIRLTPFANHRSTRDARPSGSTKATLDDLIIEAGIKRVTLAAQSGVSTASIVRINQGAPTSKITVIKLLKVLKKYLNRNIHIEDIEGLNITK